MGPTPEVGERARRLTPAHADSSGGGTRDRLRRLAVAIVVALSIAMVALAYVASTSDAPAEIVGGDYPAFYGAGTIAAEGAWDELYDLDRQTEAQRGLHDSDGAAVYFPYPPQVAAVYAPLAQLPYAASWLVHTAIMAGLLWAAILASRPMIRWIVGYEIVAFAAALCFWPMFRAVTGGSNTSLTILLIVGAWRLTHERRDLLAGLVLSGLLFKPHLGVPLIGLFLIGRYWRVVMAATIGMMVWLVSGAVAMGQGWVADWLESVLEFGPIDAEMNGHSSISFVGFTENIAGVGSSAVGVGWLIVALTIAAMCVLWFRLPRADLDMAIALTIPGVLLISPHTMTHDGALVLITVAYAVYVSMLIGRSWRSGVVALWLVGLLQAWILAIGFSPGLFMVIGVAMWMLFLARQTNWTATQPDVQSVGVR